MVDLFLKLIDNLIQLGKRREEINRNTFSDFVQPIMDDFETVHNDYISSFQRYMKMLKNEDIHLTSKHPVLQEIRNDNLFSESLRSKLIELDSIIDNHVIGHFASMVKWYLSGATTPPEHIEYEEWDGISQSRRVKFKNSLKEILSSEKTDQEKRTLAIGAIHESVDSLQHYYGDIIREHIELKKKLLKAI